VTSSAAPSFNFGGTSTAGAFGTTTTSSLFGGGFGTTNTATSGAGFGGFGSTFGSNFAKPAQPPAFGGFGTTNTGFGQMTNAFGQPQQQQQPQQPALTPEQIFLQSIYNVSIFGDERDTSIARWNYLQAQWGSGGKAFYSQNNPPVDIEPQNQLCRFKTMGYSRLPGKENKMGLVILKLAKTSAQIR
jgi:nuclear pore complex protein Nup54